MIVAGRAGYVKSIEPQCYGGDTRQLHDMHWLVVELRLNVDLQNAQYQLTLIGWARAILYASE